MSTHLIFLPLPAVASEVIHGDFNFNFLSKLSQENLQMYILLHWSIMFADLKAAVNKDCNGAGHADTSS